jgi:very-short-patch-repair endonuclease
MSIKLTQEEFEYKANSVHNGLYKYGEYNGNKIKMKIYCYIHGEFEQRPDSHIYQKQGCPECKPNHKKYTKEKVVEMANKIHNNKYKYPDDYKKMNSIWNIECEKHGIFKQKVSNHIHLGHGCSNCNNNSIGENKIKFLLEKNNIKFLSQKKFKDCKNKRELPFDFYLVDYNICIEFDGIQHFDERSKYFSDSIIINDKIKTDYCEEKGIKLIRIRYDENIEEKLIKLIK